MRIEGDSLSWLKSDEENKLSLRRRKDFIQACPPGTLVMNTRLSANQDKAVTGYTLDGDIYYVDRFSKGWVDISGKLTWHVNEILPVGQDLGSNNGNDRPIPFKIA